LKEDLRKPEDEGPLTRKNEGRQKLFERRSITTKIRGGGKRDRTKKNREGKKR